MKTTTRKLAQHYGVKYSELIEVLKDLPEDVVKLSSNGRVTVLNQESFEQAIADLKPVESFGLAVTQYQPDDSLVIDAEIVSDDITTVSQQIAKQTQDNQISLREIAKLSAKQYAQELVNAYREAILETLVKGKEEADKDVLGILGKSLS